MRQDLGLAVSRRTCSSSCPAHLIPTVLLLLVLLASTTGLVLAGSAAPIGSLTATDTIRGTISQIISLLNDPELKRPDRSEERRRRIEALISEQVSFEEMARRVLGGTWRELEPAERRDFVALFIQLLRDRFANSLFEYSDEQVHYLGERSKDAYTEVRTHLSGSKVDLPILYRVVKTTQGWRVFDVVIDDVGLASNYRAQCQAILAEASYAALVKTMRGKVLATKLFEREVLP